MALFPSSSPCLRALLYRNPASPALRKWMVRGLLILLLWICGSAQTPAAEIQFEGRSLHPLAVTPDGTFLLAANAAAGSLSVFHLAPETRTLPLLIAEIATGMEPVTVRARTNSEVWVVNELSDSISIIDLHRRVVVDTLQVPDEPADVLFAGTKAFVTCARNHRILVLDAAARVPIAIIPLEANYPRALGLNSAGDRLYVCCLMSGNQTTLLPAAAAPAPPSPANPALPPAPRTSLIVPADDPRISWKVLDHDVAEIDVATHEVLKWFSGIGTHLFDAAIHPVHGDLWIANSNSLNAIATEPALRGHFVDHRVTRLQPASGSVQVHDLNPGIDYQLLPNPAAREVALAQPTALVFTPDGTQGWIAAFHSDRLARLDSSGNVVARVDLRTVLPENPDAPPPMRGPRALALHPGGRQLYVLNRLSDSLTILTLPAGTIAGEIPLSSNDTVTPDSRAGRALLYDARLSGNGTSSCASCHLDADTDGLAWDLGDPGGTMVSVQGQNLSLHDFTSRERSMHPMKGPMLTQTLRGLEPGQKLHWRGDRAGIADFNATFRDLMGGDLLPAADMGRLGDWLLTLRHHPNPHRLPDNSRPSQLSGGDANAGRLLFLNHERTHCAVCHILPSGSDHNIDLMQEVGSLQPVKTPPLRTLYQRPEFQTVPGSRNISGFGLLKDGSAATSALPQAHTYALSDFQTAQQFKDVTAFLLAFDTGTPPITGFTRTIRTFPAPDSTAASDLQLLETRASTAGTQPECDLIVHGLLAGTTSRFLWDRATRLYLSDNANAAGLTRPLLLSLLQTGDLLTFTAVPPGSGRWRILDRNRDGTPDSAEAPPALEIRLTLSGLQLHWMHSDSSWYPEHSAGLTQDSWQPLPWPVEADPGGWTARPLGGLPSGFFHLRRTW